ncbi:MAG: IS200/IS605 family transposase [Chloroflexi bacterium]|nr:IS200/IS605 family transposase [Chloroflexota bacterium]MBU1750869.1 IS200/IS605 family transposase [Chloroflexota bacterium]
MTQTRRTRHAVYNLNYHVVWIPKYRRHVLTGPIAVRLREILVAIADQYGLEILAFEGMPDHIHLFVSAPPRYSPAQLVNLFKGISSRRLRQEFPALRRRPQRQQLWTHSYYIGTAGTVSAVTIRRYIENQQAGEA